MANLSITAANVLRQPRSDTNSGVAGASITQGQVIYRDPTDNSLKLADADAAATAPSATGQLFIALSAAATGQPIAYLTTGQVTIGATLTVGTAYYLSTTSGSICLESDLASGDFPIFLGFAISTTVLNFTPLAAGVAKA